MDYFSELVHLVYTVKINDCFLQASTQNLEAVVFCPLTSHLHNKRGGLPL